MARIVRSVLLMLALPLSRSAAQLPARADTARATVVAVIAEDSPRTPYFFGLITGSAIDAAGRVYVTDGKEARVAVFNPNGTALTTIGRKGKGPGEFERPTGPVFGADGALYVRNMSTVLRFVPDASGVAKRFDRAFAGPTFAPWMSNVASVIDRSARFHFPLEWGSSVDGLTHNAYQRYTLDGRRLDSIAVPVQPTARSTWASVNTSASGGRMIAGIAMVPFHPVPVFAMSANGTMLSSAADKYLIQETDASGKVMREFTRSVPVPPIPPSERADSARALAARLDSLRVPLSEVRGMSEEVKAGRLPTTYPVFRSLTVAFDGTVWARRWSAVAQRNASVFDVLSADGRFLRTVVVPIDCATSPAPIVRGATLVCVKLDPETGAESLALARVPAGGA